VKIGRWLYEKFYDLLKSPIPQWWGTWKSNPEPVSGTASPAKVNQFRLVGPLITSSYNENGQLSLLTVWLTERQTNCPDHMTSALVEVIARNNVKQIWWNLWVTNSALVRVAAKCSAIHEFTRRPIRAQCSSHNHDGFRWPSNSMSHWTRPRPIPALSGNSINSAVFPWNSYTFT